MARPLRIEYPGALYHITSRGNAQQAIFLDDPDRTSFWRRIVTAHETHEYTLKEIGDHLGLHYSTVSRLNTGEREKTSKSKT